MIDNEDYLEDEDFGQEQPGDAPASLDEQEQINSNELTRNIEDQNSSDFDESDDILNNSIENSEGTSDFLERSIPLNPREDDAPTTKNLKGDNPPGSEQKAFDSGLQGDMGADQVKYNADNIQENFRENLDKTSSEINLDKRLKDS